MSQTNPAEAAHPAFEPISSTAIESLNVVVSAYRHRRTGAMHYHIASDFDENVFLVGLRTVPMDSTGVAHILEHTALCGSRHFPVRDPFFMMLRRSLNTFMNAFTSSDWTAYPFASQNRKDFFNLLEVYLDAVFFSRLDPLDFAQEGHRIEFAEPDDPSSPLVYKGVVYNEMKGAMSSPVNTLWQALSSHLFPTTTYHYNSGGDPAHIPDLGYDDLLAFYRSHYHPSNAVFMTFGTIPATEHQAFFETRALHHFERLDETISVPDECRFSAPLRVVERYACEGEDLEERTHIVIGWLLGHSTDIDELLRDHLLSSILLDNSASPLRHALETTSLGSAPSPLCGLEDSNREITFVCGIEGSRPEHAAALETLVVDCLEDVANRGVPRDQIEAALHQLEFAQREITGNGYPYGLHLILSALPAAVHRGDVTAALNIDPALARLRTDAERPDFVQRLVRERLLDNPHRVRLTMRPDARLARERDEEEAARLAAIKRTMDDEALRAVRERTRALEERQQQTDDPEILPRVGLEDVPPTMSIAEGEERRIGRYRLDRYAQGTNGLSYQEIVIDLPNLPMELLELLPLYGRCLTELGSGGRDYLATQSWQARISGGLSAYSSVRGTTTDVDRVRGHMILSGKALGRNNAALAELMQQTIETVRFDELPHIREIVAQDRARREQAVVQSGHSLAMLAASSTLSPAARLSHELRGLAGLRRLKALDDGLDDPDRLAALAERLAALHALIQAAPRRFLLIAEAEHLDAYERDLGRLWSDAPNTDTDWDPLQLPIPDGRIAQAWTTRTQVSFCAMAFPTVPPSHEDAAALDVLAGFLRNGYLHRAIREQGGAYGGGASHDADNASFRFYSYRDPRLAETLDDFRASIDWLFETDHEPRTVEEAILGVVGQIDRPASPAGEAKDAYHNALHGRDRTFRETYRRRVCAVGLDDLRRVAETYLRKDEANTVVVTSPEMAEAPDTPPLETVAL